MLGVLTVDSLSAEVVIAAPVVISVDLSVTIETVCPVLV